MSKRAGEDDDRTPYKVVVSGERYSIWPADRENARGWKNAGKAGTKKECLAYIEQVGKEKRPKGPRGAAK